MAWSAKIMHESYSAMGNASNDRRMAVLPSKWTMRRFVSSRRTSSPAARKNALRSLMGIVSLIMWSSEPGATCLSSCLRMSRMSRRQPQQRIFSWKPVPRA